MISPSSTLSHGHHRRQISAPFEAVQTPDMSRIPPYRAHRRGETMDYSSFGPQVLSVDRQIAPNKVTQLRDYFNEKAGYQQQTTAAQQFEPSFYQDQQAFNTSGHPLQPQHYQSNYPWSLDEVQEMYPVSGNPVNLNASIAPALARSASENSSPNVTMKGALRNMREPRDSRRWQPFPHQARPVFQKGRANGYAQSMEHFSVQPEVISSKMNAYLSYTSPLTPDPTPMKHTFDFSTYNNDHTPTKSQSFSLPRMPACEMQRAHSLQAVHESSPLQLPQQMPSPAISSMDSFAELAAMPSPGSCGVSPQKSSVPPTPSMRNRRQRAESSASSISQLFDDVKGETVDEFDLDARVKASVKNSSVSSDEIAKYISGPDPEDNKWVCLFAGCNCRFGRKENIKSHVQTHLNDRQYVCDRCGKDFVRGHDLKRHLKTHSGSKPFACACGASFARQDALTRHRQRDMCVGGFTGFVPKTTKRGRPPKKTRPDMETRQTKSARTRQRVAEKATSVSPVKSESYVLQEAPVFVSPKYTPSSAMSSITPPASPGAVMDNAQSPTQSGFSLNSQQFEDDMLPLPLSPPQLAHNRYARAMEGFNAKVSVECPQQGSFYSENAVSSYDVSSPHSAPTLAGSSVGSEIDVFMSQDSSNQLQEEIDSLASQTFSTLPTSYASYVDSSDFGLGSSIYPDDAKVFSLPSFDMESYSDQIDSLSSEFLVDP
ncbi:hypothetical protein N7495_008008 [Penicillium taxi]|uniref:uncharacterized protein n=1 Tax=Penicillium taxi TaxID=168475 RepID=UPI00254583D7|nr:uncharacterized protein N7495_008008 [Penicillium taxi]KAJ5887967.1 hypothetical protein N7495_008008 [Penicillium taxi]